MFMWIQEDIYIDWNAEGDTLPSDIIITQWIPDYITWEKNSSALEIDVNALTLYCNSKNHCMLFVQILDPSVFYTISSSISKEYLRFT